MGDHSGCPCRTGTRPVRSSRRAFLRSAGIVGAGLAATGAIAACDRLPMPFELFGQRIGVERRQGLEYRAFGRTGEKVSLLGLGGYHMLEISQDEVTEITKRFVAMGGNYVETAYSYGNGQSERKMGIALKGLREGVFLATKTAARGKREAADMLKVSLDNLQTDHLDLWIMHSVQDLASLELVLAPDGALRAAQEARDAGQVRYIGISAHGWADTLIEALNRYPFDAVMHTFNYLDRFNYPSGEKDLLPLAASKGVAVIGMKPVGDGYLYRSPGPAFRYALTLPCSTMVSGINSLEFLDTDMGIAKGFSPMSRRDQERLFAEAPELGDYVCRQCGKCMPNLRNVPIPAIFQLEGMADRQMDDMRPHEAQDLGLRIRLGGFFGTNTVARQRYRALKINSADLESCAEVAKNCPYGIDIVRKLKIVHAKLG